MFDQEYFWFEILFIFLGALGGWIGKIFVIIREDICGYSTFHLIYSVYIFVHDTSNYGHTQVLT